MDKINLLTLEDSLVDAELMIKTLENSDIEFHNLLATNKSEFIQAIDHHKFDAILADNQLLGFNASDALEILKERNMHIPFILVTGTISEEFAVEMMKEGTWDYILKDRLQRLPNALKGCLQKYKLEQERNKYLSEIIAKESTFIEAARLAGFGSWEINFVDGKELWSDEQYRILGYAPNEVEPTLDNLLNRVHPDDVTLTRETIDNAFRDNARQRFNARIIHKDGGIKYVIGEMVSTLDEHGKVLRINGFIQDVTQTREAELKEKQITEDLLRRNKDLEQFSYIISHNLRSPVANITGLANMLAEEKLSEEERGYFVNALSTSTKKLQTVITDLHTILQVSRNINENKENVDFNTLVDEVTFSLGIRNSEKIPVHCDFTETDGMFTLKSYMYSIFYNLMSNSIKFRKPDAEPEIWVRSFYNKIATGLVFTDNGLGIDLEQNSQKIFGLYKRFHADYTDGRGMGLFMVKAQVETLGGKISVQSKTNEGTTFTIEFPA